MKVLENAHGLIIGIADYQNVGKLPSTVINDVEDIHALLVDPQYCGYPEDNVRLLRDGEATRAAIDRALAELAERSNEGSTVFFYISSHGGRIDSGPYAGEYLLPVDAVYTSRESIAQTAVSGAQFSQALSDIPARKVLVVFDCCHSGDIGYIKDANVPKINALPERYYDVLKEGRGRVILASSRSTEYSYIMPNDENSLFTKHLLTGLRGGIASDDGVVRIFDLFEYLQPKVTIEKPQQHPLFISKVEQNFAVALYLGGKKAVIPTDEGGFRYDVYVSYAEDNEQDAGWVWEQLWPRLNEADLRVAISDDVAEQGVSRVVNMERGIKQSRRTVIVLSPQYLANNMAQFESVMAQTMSIEAGSARMIPVIVEPFDTSLLPYRLSTNIVIPADLSKPGKRSEIQFGKLIRTLQGPLRPLF